MTKFQALFIKLMRVRYGYSWRVISSEWQYRYVPKQEWFHNPAMIELHNSNPELLGKYDYNRPGELQHLGMQLCGDAMNYLGEDWEEEFD